VSWFNKGFKRDRSRTRKTSKVKLICKLQGYLVDALAVVAGCIVISVPAVIIYDVAARNFGWESPAWPVPYSEYALLYITLFTAPWLLRSQGHVSIDVLRRSLQPGARRALEIVIYLICLLVSVTISVFAFKQMVFTYGAGQLDARGVNFPRWLLYLPLLISFTLMSIEFITMCFGAYTIYKPNVQDIERL
jgi:TRAP-type C4-dicarboxylate transport system permease small subunit